MCYLSFSPVFYLLRLFPQVDCNADLNAVDNKGNTPLLSVCDFQIDYTSTGAQESSANIVEFLVAQESIHVDIQNKNERTALFCSMMRGKKN